MAGLLSAEKIEPPLNRHPEIRYTCLAMMQAEPQLQRVDKWLWVARFFKTRSLANQAVSGGKIQVDGKRVKPARTVTAGSRIRIRKGPNQWDIIVKSTAAQRQPSPQARELYEETTQSVERRLAAVATRREANQERALDPGRPSKNTRRELVRLKRS